MLIEIKMTNTEITKLILEKDVLFLSDSDVISYSQFVPPEYKVKDPSKRKVTLFSKNYECILYLPLIWDFEDDDSGEQKK